MVFPFIIKLSFIPPPGLFSVPQMRTDVAAHFLYSSTDVGKMGVTDKISSFIMQE